MVPRPVTAEPACDATPDSGCTVPAPSGTNVGSVGRDRRPRIVKRPEAMLIGLQVSFRRDSTDVSAPRRGQPRANNGSPCRRGPEQAIQVAHSGRVMRRCDPTRRLDRTRTHPETHPKPAAAAIRNIAGTDLSVAAKITRSRRVPVGHPSFQRPFKNRHLGSNPRR